MRQRSRRQLNARLVFEIRRLGREYARRLEVLWDRWKGEDWNGKVARAAIAHKDCN